MTAPCREAEFPAEQAGQAGSDHIACVIERLVAAILPVEAGLPHNAERHARHRRPDRRARDRRRHLGDGDSQKFCDRELTSRSRRKLIAASS
jgi:hypothetical protein